MMNGQMNGFHNSLIEEDCFLFTSESVGEGHPGEFYDDACRPFSGKGETRFLRVFNTLQGPDGNWDVSYIKYVVTVLQHFFNFFF